MLQTHVKVEYPINILGKLVMSSQSVRTRLIFAWGLGFVLLALLGTALGQELGDNAVSSKIPGVSDVAKRDLYIWAVVGAVAGYVLNARHPDYQGVKPLLAKYGYQNVPGWILIVIDTMFYVGVGPLMVIGMFEPNAIVQAVTLGFGWPMVVRGVETNLK